jgi:antitoxin component YwqK of YwqJK toxin-antitoxin module
MIMDRKDGKEDVVYTGWHENGQKGWEGTYKDGELISEECWDEDGNDEECK